MDDTAVMAALMACNFIFFLHEQKLLPRKPSRDFERDPEADCASTDDNYVVTRIRHDGGTGVMSATA